MGHLNTSKQCEGDKPVVKIKVLFFFQGKLYIKRLWDCSVVIIKKYSTATNYTLMFKANNCFSSMEERQ